MKDGCYCSDKNFFEPHLKLFSDKAKRRGNSFVKFSWYKCKWRSVIFLTTLNTSFEKKRIDEVTFLWTALNTSLLVKTRDVNYSALINYDILGRTCIKKMCCPYLQKEKKCIDVHVLTRQLFSMYINKSIVFNLHA